MKQKELIGLILKKRKSIYSAMHFMLFGGINEV